jgi:uncharacterized protein (TIGR03085 family)
VTDFASRERAALADLLEAVGPDAPTLCEGWTARDLAAHLVVRASRPDAAAGIVIRGLAEHTRKVQDRAAAGDWSDLVAKVRRRPWWGALLDEPFNRVEYFVHHEDVRRAQPGWQPREISAEFAAALWSRVRPQARLVLRRTPATVTVTAPGFGRISAGRGGHISDRVDLVGPPGELLLFLMGRQDHARVEIAGPEQITSRMRHARYGI